MNRKINLSVLVIVISIFLSGCWSRRELNDLALASAIGLDKAGSEIRVTVQIINPSEVAAKAGGGGGYQTPVTVYSTTAKTVLEATRKLTTIAPRKVYLSQLRVVVIGEELAREGIGPALDYLARDREVREEDLYTLIAKGESARETLKVLTHLDKIPAMKMYGAMKTLQKYWAPTSAIQLSEITFDLMTLNKHPAISGIVVQGNKGDGDTKKTVETTESTTYLQFIGTAAFHKDKLVGWLDESESKGYNYITNRVVKTAGKIACPNGGVLALDVIRTKTKVTGYWDDENPRIEVAVRMESNVADVQCDIDLADPETILLLQKKGEEQLKSVIHKALNKVQHELKTDIFGFGAALHRSNRQAWKNIQKDWDRTFPDVPVNVKTKMLIRNLGTMGNSLQKEIEE